MFEDIWLMLLNQLSLFLTPSRNLKPSPNLLLPFAAAAVLAGKSNWLQEIGDSQLQEGQRCCQQQDEIHQVCAVQHHRGCPLCAPGLLLVRCQETAHPDRHPLLGHRTGYSHSKKNHFSKFNKTF